MVWQTEHTTHGKNFTDEHETPMTDYSIMRMWKVHMNVLLCHIMNTVHSGPYLDSPKFQDLIRSIKTQSHQVFTASKNRLMPLDYSSTMKQVPNIQDMHVLVSWSIASYLIRWGIVQFQDGSMKTVVWNEKLLSQLVKITKVSQLEYQRVLKTGELPT